MWAGVGLGLVAASGYFLSRKRYRDVFTPLFVYLLAWCSCLLLFNLRLINYDELQTRTILIIGWSMLAFVLGCLSAGRPSLSKPVSFEVVLPSLEKVIKVLVLANLVGLFFFVLRMARTFGIAAYFSDPVTIRLNYEDLGRTGALALLVLVNYPLFLCSLVHYLKSGKLRWFSGVGVCLPAVQGYLAMSRNLLAIPLATGFFVWCYLNRWRSLNKRIVTRSALVLSLIGAYFILVGAWYGKNTVSDNSSFKQQDFNITSQIALQFVDPYLYATGSFPTLQAAMGDVHEHLWGTRTFFPIARLLYAAGLLRERPENNSLEFYLVPIPFNTYTYLFSVYEDFGMVAMLLFPFLLGWLGTKMYLQMRTRPTIFSICATAAFMMVSLYSVFTPLFSSFQLWYCLLLLFVISRRCGTLSLHDSAWRNAVGQTVGHVG